MDLGGEAREDREAGEVGVGGFTGNGEREKKKGEKWVQGLRGELWGSRDDGVKCSEAMQRSEGASGDEVVGGMMRGDRVKRGDSKGGEEGKGGKKGGRAPKRE